MRLLHSAPALDNPSHSLLFRKDCTELAGERGQSFCTATPKAWAVCACLCGGAPQIDPLVVKIERVVLASNGRCGEGIAAGQPCSLARAVEFIPPAELTGSRPF